jgi:hypothetical protein
MEKIKKYPVYVITLLTPDRTELSYRENGQLYYKSFFGGKSGWDKEYKHLKCAIRKANELKETQECRWVKVHQYNVTETIGEGDNWSCEKRDANKVVYEV